MNSSEIYVKDKEDVKRFLALCLTFMKKNKDNELFFSKTELNKISKFFDGDHLLTIGNNDYDLEELKDFLFD